MNSDINDEFLAFAANVVHVIFTNIDVNNGRDCLVIKPEILIDLQCKAKFFDTTGNQIMSKCK